MDRRFLVASDDEPVSAWPPAIVRADDEDGAIDRYLRMEYSKDPIFRQSVLELSINGSFIEKFFIVSVEENRSFETTGRVKFDLHLIIGQVMAFFSTRPDLGEKYVHYMESRDVSHLNDEVFEFIAASDATGIVALDLDEMRQF